MNSNCLIICISQSNQLRIKSPRASNEDVELTIRKAAEYLGGGCFRKSLRRKTTSPFHCSLFIELIHRARVFASFARAETLLAARTTTILPDLVQIIWRESRARVEREQVHWGNNPARQLEQIYRRRWWCSWGSCGGHQPLLAYLPLSVHCFARAAAPTDGVCTYTRHQTRLPGPICHVANAIK